MQSIHVTPVKYELLVEQGKPTTFLSTLRRMSLMDKSGAQRLSHFDDTTISFRLLL